MNTMTKGPNINLGQFKLEAFNALVLEGSVSCLIAPAESETLKMEREEIAFYQLFKDINAAEI